MKHAILLLIFSALAYGQGTMNGIAGQTAATGHQLQVTYQCADSSGSGTAQSCTTSPTFTPAPPDCITYTTTTTNSGTGLTINVNSLGAKSVAIASASGWSTTLTANVIPANKPQRMCYDAAGWWDDMQTGTASGAPYPSGTGIPQVSGGTSWGTTLTVGEASGDVALVGSTPTFIPIQIPAGTTLGSSFQILAPQPFGIAMSLPTNGTCTSSLCVTNAILGTLPAASWAITVYYETACTGTPTSLGTISIGTTGTVTTSLTAHNFAANDCWSLSAPSSVDTTAAAPLSISVGFLR